MKIVDGQVVVRKRADIQWIYFIQARTLKLIKIGLAERIEVRIRQLAASGPDKLEVLGIKACNRGGDLETELHEMFAIHRSHGEWFYPAREILDYIYLHADTSAKTLNRLDDVAAYPIMGRGRPRVDEMEKRALAGLGKWR